MIHFHELANGIHLTGNKNAPCHFDTCVQAKIRRAQNARHRALEDPARLFGDHFSTDVKFVPYESFPGYKFVVNFVDHITRLGMCFFMRHKERVLDKFRLLVAEMAHYGFAVDNLQTEVAELRQDITTLRSLSLSEQQQQQKHQHLPFGPMRPPHLPPQQWWPSQHPVFFA